MTASEARARIISYVPWVQPEQPRYDLARVHPQVRPWIDEAVDQLEAAGLVRREGDVVLLTVST